MSGIYRSDKNKNHVVDDIQELVGFFGKFVCDDQPNCGDRGLTANKIGNLMEIAYAKVALVLDGGGSPGLLSTSTHLYVRAIAHDTKGKDK